MGDHSSIDASILLGTTRASRSGNRDHDIKTEEENGCTKIFSPPEIRQRSVEARRERDATEEKRNAQIRKRKDRKEPETGDRHRAVRGAEEGREGPSPAHGAKELREKEAEPLMRSRY